MGHRRKKREKTPARKSERPRQLRGVSGVKGSGKEPNLHSETGAQTSSPSNVGPDPDAKPTPSAGSRISRRKRWAFRLAAAVGIPLALFAILELGLRMGGYGYPIGFLLERQRDGQPVFTENDRFGWRFFGRRLSRTPAPFSISRDKPKGTIRVFVFGESAAYGDPMPDYGLPRMLEAMLSTRHPAQRFEVINAAMTGINSHAVREIAEDCVAAQGDIWVVYMGNNEVVGPFGAGTVFGSQTPPLSLVRANLALKATRSGQLLDGLVQAVTGPATDADNWGGMQLFIDNQVRRADPRMDRVYHHFERNLRAILDIGRQSDIGVVVSTVAVNLRDCAPFGSAPDPGLTAEQSEALHGLYVDAVARLEAGQAGDAAAAFQKAAQTDDQDANLHFRWGQALLAMGNVAEARRQFELARDLDTLRFRCDSRLNAIVRDVASGREDEGIRLVNAAEEFHKHSAPQISGKEFFYEHVHLTFAGNYLLARLLAEQVEALLPERAASGAAAAAADWPTLEQCADRLAWSDLALRGTLAEMLARLNDPPFTGQLNHSEQVQEVSLRLLALQQASKPSALAAAAEQCQRAIEASPNDHVLYSRLALLLGQAGDLDGAYQAALKASQLLPHQAGKWFQLGLVLAMQGRDEDAVEAFHNSLARDRDNVWTLLELAKTLSRLDRTEEAMDQLQRAAQINPRFGLAYLTMGLIFEERGQTEEAEVNFRKALANRIHRAADLATLAQLCQQKGWFKDAVDNYRDALRLNPADPALHLGAAQCLDALGEHAEAEQHFQELIRLAPRWAQGRYLFGVHWAKLEDHARAAEQFAAAAELNPDFLPARVDFAMALIASGREREALTEFKEVLARDPNHATALEFKAAIEKELGLPPNQVGN